MKEQRKPQPTDVISSHEAVEIAVALTKEQGTLWEAPRRFRLPSDKDGEPETVDQAVPCLAENSIMAPAGS
jgi:hypothetical protein